MKSNDLEDVRQVYLSLIEQKAKRRDVLALLILLREHLTAKNHPMLLDIAHCVAHTRRDRGIALVYIDNFVKHLVYIAHTGGVLEVKTLFPIDEVVQQLSNALKSVGVEVNEAKLMMSSRYIENVLHEVLEGIEFKIAHPNVASCIFQTGQHNGVKRFAFEITFKDMHAARILPIPESLPIGFPVFSSE